MPTAATPPELLLTLLPFQRESLGWFLLKETSESGSKGGILADEMGMGKTIQMIALFLTDLHMNADGKYAPSIENMQIRERQQEQEQQQKQQQQEQEQQNLSQNLDSSLLDTSMSEEGSASASASASTSVSRSETPQPPTPITMSRYYTNTFIILTCICKAIHFFMT